jgi:hypothetical protein
MAARDGSMTGRILTQRRGVWFKELICRSTIWALKMERIGISGIQWVRGHDERGVPDTYPSGL